MVGQSGTAVAGTLSEMRHQLRLWGNGTGDTVAQRLADAAVQRFIAGLSLAAMVERGRALQRRTRRYRDRFGLASSRRQADAARSVLID